MDKRADPRYLREVAYAEPSRLATRAALYAHQQPRIDLVAEALGMLGDVGGCDVVDIGCGPGRYTAALRAAGAHVVGVDLSAGMVAAGPVPRVPAAVGDAQALPIAADAFDVAVMMHMLYHLGDPELGLREARRVLRPGGRLLAGTNAPEHLVEMNEIWAPLLASLGVQGRPEDLGLVNARLDADATRQLIRERFVLVDERRLRAAVVVTDPAPVVAHAATTTGAHMAGGQRAELLARFEDQVARSIRRDGELRITTDVVLFLAQRG